MNKKILYYSNKYFNWIQNNKNKLNKNQMNTQFINNN